MIMNYGNPTHGMDLHSSLDKICSFLNDGFCWHKRAANQCRKFGMRGWGRIHDMQSGMDGDTLITLEKMIGDNLNYYPKYDHSKLDNYSSAVINNMEEFKQHHAIWKAREQAILPAINSAIHELRTVNIELYNKFCELAKRIQSEVMRIDLIVKRCDFAGWNTHDIGVISKWLHEQAESNEIQGHDINANIG